MPLPLNGVHDPIYDFVVVSALLTKPNVKIAVTLSATDEARNPRVTITNRCLAIFACHGLIVFE